MQISLQDKWNNHYQSSQQPGSVSRVLTDNAHLLPLSARALDLACGLGANALFMAARKLSVEAWDISEQALLKLESFAGQRALSISTQQRNVEENPPGENSFDVIVVSHFLYRPICKDLMAALRPQGILFYQTYCREKVSPGGPENEKFLLQAAELPELFAGLEILAYREERDAGDTSLGFRNQAYLVARKPA
jgi:2-polyprenyl-3-methyl-5-hydroxy-6-metoxy-1,4-benzoquinol methylase